MISSSVKQRREKLVQQFELMIQDEQKMNQFEQMFRGMLNSTSLLSDDQKEEVLKTREQVRSGEMKTTPWNEVKTKLDSKYGV